MSDEDRKIHTCLNWGDCMVSFTSSAELDKSPTSGKNCDNRCLMSGSASNGASDSVLIAVDKSTKLGEK